MFFSQRLGQHFFNQILFGLINKLFIFVWLEQILKMFFSPNLYLAIGRIIIKFCYLDILINLIFIMTILSLRFFSLNCFIESWSSSRQCNLTQLKLTWPELGTAQPQPVSIFVVFYLVVFYLVILYLVIFYLVVFYFCRLLFWSYMIRLCCADVLTAFRWLELQ